MTVSAVARPGTSASGGTIRRLLREAAVVLSALAFTGALWLVLSLGRADGSASLGQDDGVPAPDTRQTVEAGTSASPR